MPAGNILERNLAVTVTHLPRLGAAAVLALGATGLATEPIIGPQVRIDITGAVKQCVKPLPLLIWLCPASTRPCGK